MKANKNIWDIALGGGNIASKTSLRVGVCNFGFEMCLRENKNSLNENECLLWFTAAPKIELTLPGGKRTLEEIFKNLEEENENLHSEQTRRWGKGI
jgi:hypothetical protein